MIQAARRDSYGDAPMTPKAPGPASRWTLSPLVRDLGLILVVKFALLTALWWAFFSHPVAPDMRVEPQRVGEHVFAVSSDTVPESAHAKR